MDSWNRSNSQLLKCLTLLERLVTHGGGPAGEEIRGFILTNTEKHSSDIARLVGEHFAISRQAVNKHLKNLVAEGALVPEGKTMYRKYKLAALLEWRKLYILGPEIEEDLVWSRDVSLVLGNLPKNVMDIWHF